MTKNGRFLPGSFPAQERTDRCRVCLAPIGVMSVYRGWGAEWRLYSQAIVNSDIWRAQRNALGHIHGENSANVP